MGRSKRSEGALDNVIDFKAIDEEVKENYDAREVIIARKMKEYGFERVNIDDVIQKKRDNIMKFKDRKRKK